MPNILIFLRSEAKRLSALAVWGIKHPSTTRKAAVATLTHVAALVAAFGFFFPNISTGHAAVFTACTGAITWLTTFLTSNRVVEVADDLQQPDSINV